MCECVSEAMLRCSSTTVTWIVPGTGTAADPGGAPSRANRRTACSFDNSASTSVDAVRGGA
jgi:hypothetical protein